MDLQSLIENWIWEIPGHNALISPLPTETCAHWLWLMIRIAEKLGFMKVRAVTVCAKAGISRKVGTNNHVFLAISNKTASKTKILDSSR